MELERLPDHVLIEIFRSLSTHDLVNYRRVSKRWFRLIRCPKYFQRAHHLCFNGCTLSATCLPLSVFKNSSQPFFRCLTIGEKVDYNLDDDWENSWLKLGNRISYLNFRNSFSIISHVLGDGSNWSQLIELGVALFEANFPQKLKIPSLKTLKMMNGDSSLYLEKNFPNLQNFHFKKIYYKRFTDWELRRLREVECDPSQLRALHTNTIQKMSLGRHYEIDSNGKQFIESFVSKQENLLELKIDLSGIPSLEYWCNWTQLTELRIWIRALIDPPLGTYFTQLKNLKCINIELYGTQSSCFFGHEPVDLPCLDKYSVSTPNQCEECWKSCLQSFTNAKDGTICKFEKIKKYSYLLQNLETLKSDRVDCCLKVGDEEDRDLDFKPLPNVLKLISRCYHKTHEKDLRAIAGYFPNLRLLEISSFNPIILTLLPGLQELFLNYHYNCSQDMMGGIVQYGKNLRVINFRNHCTKENAKYLLDNLELLVQVSTSYHDKVYTRSSFE